MKNRLSLYTSLLALAALPLSVGATVALAPSIADACGCFSPPVPDAVEGDEYAVNQQAEQIIFEVNEEDGTVSAHVLIRYSGDPEQFAWLVPVPNVPELELSAGAVFGVLGGVTDPNIGVDRENLCPDSDWICRQHPEPDCDYGTGTSAGSTDPTGVGTGGVDTGDPPDGIDVLDMQQIGSYETITFAAEDAALAVQWLQDNDFIVNDTMTPYMMPYIDAQMVFVAAKLIPGADLDELRPLKMTYQGTQPMIPLQLTAVAADPHLTVTSYIYADSYHKPEGHPLVELDPARISESPDGRVNYPMALARAVDDGGHDAFVIEYAGNSPEFIIDDPGGCCDGGGYYCGIENDGLCQCPGYENDIDDCGMFPELLEGIELMDQLGESHARMTRLTTRVSGHEMNFDPMFESNGDENPASFTGALSLTGHRGTLASCDEDIIDVDPYNQIEALQGCASIYCDAGTCAATGEGAGCDCNPQSVAMVFTDLDGERSVTCVPEQAPVDLGAGGINLPDACAGVDCGLGSCVDVNGFATCQCDDGAAAVVQADGSTPVCATITFSSGTPGAEDYTGDMPNLQVCRPVPPTCGGEQWYAVNPNKQIQGVNCDGFVPTPEQLVPPPAPGCGGDTTSTSTSAGTGDTDIGTTDGGGSETGPTTGTGPSGCGCSSDDDSRGLGLLSLGLLVPLLLGRRRRVS